MKTKLFPVIVREINGKPTPTVEMNFNDQANYAEACCCCGKRTSAGGNLFAHYAIAGYWIPFAEHQDTAVSQGCFPIGPECAKRFPKEFVGSL